MKSNNVRWLVHLNCHLYKHYISTCINKSPCIEFEELWKWEFCALGLPNQILILTLWRFSFQFSAPYYSDYSLQCNHSYWLSVSCQHYSQCFWIQCMLLHQHNVCTVYLQPYTLHNKNPLPLSQTSLTFCHHWGHQHSYDHQPTLVTQICMRIA